MLSMFKMILLYSLLFFFNSALAEEVKEKNQTEFLAAVELYQQEKYDDAAKILEELKLQAPQNESILYNLGLVYLKTDQLGSALAHFRRALYLSPQLDQAEIAANLVTSKLPQQSSSTDTWENFRRYVLNQVSGSQALSVLALMIGLAGFLMIRYLGSRRQALENSTPLPTFPWAGTIFTLLTIVSLLLAIAKAYDNFNPRGTILVENTKVHSAPEKDSSALFEALEGFEVLLHKKSDDWVQVSLPGGLSGWIPQSAVMHTTGRNPW